MKQFKLLPEFSSFNFSTNAWGNTILSQNNQDIVVRSANKDENPRPGLEG
jgi:hypothetical protein